MDEALDWLGTLSSKEMIVLSDRSYHKRNIQDFFRELTKTGDLEKRVSRGQAVLRLTSQGKIRLAREIPLTALARQKWDRLFRAVSFDFPEEKNRLRDLLREHLKSLGFGMLQESLWITPYPLTEVLEEFIKYHQLSQYALIMESRHITSEGAQSLARRVWKLDGVEEAYLNFIQKWEDKLKTKENSRQQIEGEWRSEYLDLLMKDPFLPQELLPFPWIGKQAKDLFLKLERVEG